MWTTLTWAGLSGEAVVCAVLGTVATMVCAVTLRVIVYWEGRLAGGRVILFWLTLLFSPLVLIYIAAARPFVRPAELPMRWLILRPLRPLPEKVGDRGAVVLRRCLFSLVPSGIPNRYLILTFQMLTAAQETVAILMAAALAWATLSYFAYPQG